MNRTLPQSKKGSLTLIEGDENGGNLKSFTRSTMHFSTGPPLSPAGLTRLALLTFPLPAITMRIFTLVGSLTCDLHREIELWFLRSVERI